MLRVEGLGFGGAPHFFGVMPFFGLWVLGNVNFLPIWWAGGYTGLRFRRGEALDHFEKYPYGTLRFSLISFILNANHHTNINTKTQALPETMGR